VALRSGQLATIEILICEIRHILSPDEIVLYIYSFHGRTNVSHLSIEGIEFKHNTRYMSFFPRVLNAYDCLSSGQ
jgi:hypothetical protein